MNCSLAGAPGSRQVPIDSSAVVLLRYYVVAIIDYISADTANTSVCWY